MSDLLDRVAELVAIPSPSRHERDLADHVEARLAAAPWLEVTRIGHNVVGRSGGRATGAGGPRVVLAGHLDTVPAHGNERPVRDGSVLWGLGSADMKGGLAVMLDLAERPDPPRLPTTWVFYVAEEVARRLNGLLAVAAVRPDLLEGDVAVLGEPTSARVEAGCQGVLRAEVVLGGRRAHSARPWMGSNAVHRLGGVLDRVGCFVERRPVLDGCEYRESLQAVGVEGGVAGNVVPDRAGLQLSHRFAPDRTPAEAERAVADLLVPALDVVAGDRFSVTEVAPSAPPGLDHPVLAGLVAATGAPPRAKLGWTDVAFFAERGIPATNFGPGDPEVAHTADERVSLQDLETVRRVLGQVLGV